MAVESLNLRVCQFKVLKIKEIRDYFFKKREETGKFKMCNVNIMIISEQEERNKGTEEISKIIMSKNYLQINGRHQITDPESSGNTTKPSRINIKNKR